LPVCGRAAYGRREEHGKVVGYPPTRFLLWHPLTPLYAIPADRG